MPEQKEVLINLLATARYEHTPDYPIQFMTKGILSFSEDGRAELQYTESQEDEESGEVTSAQITLALEKNRVTMTREGDFSNTMVFVPMQRFEGTYKTPYGEMDMAVLSHGVRCEIGRSRGSVHLKYQLHIQGAYASSNELHLEYMADGGKRVQ